ncbi:cyclic nucleotide-binding protein [Leptolyngbya sp. Heron Island J]|uniref:Crp/Fnr family transcriptional regulator n=1 Tax=Leptolyngbya sp. Heron Island J TaxID=1385935 RepID=UPI0003B98312|nr:cyclic nucleotide-binding domain-containing protein [Leptolyngbya sp. Heron Island J]ESA34579.1 cyclic nucleotide-binding protein [Leptolyngbya sp. Heron Island J]
MAEIWQLFHPPIHPSTSGCKMHWNYSVEDCDQSKMMKTINLFNHPADFITVDAGTTIFEQGQATDSMYVLIEGKVVIKRDHQELVIVTAGNLIGEMAILENRPHFASAVAQTTCQLLPIERKRFQFLVEQTPNFAFDVMEMMAERLHQMNVRMAS